MRPGRVVRLFELLLALTWAAAAAAQRSPDADPYREGREQFLAALAAAGSATADEDTAASAALRAYPLYPYLEAIRIERALDTIDGPVGAVDARAARSIDADRGTPLERDLLGVWLGSLARRGLWQAFLDRYRPELADTTLRCEWLRARLELGESRELVSDALETWLTGHRLPSACEPVFEWLGASGRLSEELIERRVRMLLENGDPGFARVIAARLPAERAAPLLEWAELIERPTAAFDRLIRERRPSIEPEVLLDAWTRFARAEPSAAAERYKELTRSFRLDRDAREHYAAELALGLAWDRQAKAALKYFDAGGELDDYALGWRARAALWRGDWKRAEASIGAMSERQRGEARWRYWEARALEQRGKKERARTLYRSVLADDNYYSVMAAARLGRPAEPHLEVLPRDPAVMREVSSKAPFVRARELLRAGLPVRAVAEWQYGFDGLDEAERLQSVHLAARWGWYDMAIATATRQQIFNDYELLYPQPYPELVATGAERSTLAVPLLYGLIRQESLFRADAGSTAGALGLTQLTPETARRVARRSGLAVPTRSDLFDPAVSITLGAAHLRDLIDEFDGQLVVALAGYNAGRAAAVRWLPEQALANDVWIENIPYNETRLYVQRVLWHSVVFAWLESGDAQPTDAWTADVRPLGSREYLGALRR